MLEKMGWRSPEVPLQPSFPKHHVTVSANCSLGRGQQLRSLGLVGNPFVRVCFPRG